MFSLGFLQILFDLSQTLFFFLSPHEFHYNFNRMWMEGVIEIFVKLKGLIFQIENIRVCLIFSLILLLLSFLAWPVLEFRFT